MGFASRRYLAATGLQAAPDSTASSAERADPRCQEAR